MTGLDFFIIIEYMGISLELTILILFGIVKFADYLLVTKEEVKKK